MINVAIVEDDAVTRTWLIQALNDEKGLRLVGAHADAEDAQKHILAEKADLVVMDITLPKKSGIDCMKELRAQAPQLQFLMLTSHNDPDQIFASLKAGASGYLLKPIKPKELLQSIRDVRQGGAPMSSQVARKVVESFQTSSNASKMPKLTPRETEILDGLAHGLLYKEIAEKLTIGVTTVRTHLGSIYQKLHVQNRTEAVVRYLGH